MKMTDKLNIMTKERLFFIDWVKFLSIFLVLIYHSGLFENLILAGLIPICCPLLFMVNGGLILQKSRDLKYIFTKVIKIIFVIFFWKSFYVMWMLIIKSVDISFSSYFKYLINDELYFTNVFWFLKVLIVLLILYPFFVFWKNNITLLYIGCISSFFITSKFLPLTFGLENFFSDHHFYAISYYLLGYLILCELSTFREISLLKRYDKYIYIISFLISTIVNGFVVFCYAKNTNTSLGSSIYCLYNSPFSFLSCISLVLFLKSINLKRLRIVEYVSDNSLIIYIVHGIPLIFTKLILGWQNAYLTGFTVCIISLLICWLLNKSTYLKMLVTLR